jgi:glycerol uptake facilitator-like aquaporin
VSDERPALSRRAAAEGLAAFALVFAGCGAIITNSIHDGVLGAVGVSVVLGASIGAFAYQGIRTPRTPPGGEAA